MSRSFHQHHKVTRNGSVSSPFNKSITDSEGCPVMRHRKMKPYGRKDHTGIGGEIYIAKNKGRYGLGASDEICVPVINKKASRREGKNQCNEVE